MENKFIIDTPKLQTLRLKYTSTLLTFIFWVVWFYLWVPLITVVGWWFQISFFQHEILVADGLEAFLDVLPTFIGIATSLISILAIWAFYNFSRFKGKDRRKALPAIQQSDLLEVWLVTEKALNSAQSNKISVIKISAEGEIAVTGTVTNNTSTKPDNA